MSTASVKTESLVSIPSAPSQQPTFSNLPALYERLAQARPGDYVPGGPRRINAAFAGLPAERPKVAAAEYAQTLNSVVQHVAAYSPDAPPGIDELLAQAGGIDEKLDAVLGTAPRAPAGHLKEIAAACARIHADIQTLRDNTDKVVAANGGRIPIDPDTTANTRKTLASSDEKLRAIVLDVVGAANLSGKKLVSFLEHAFGGDPTALSRCMAELDPLLQPTVVDKSKLLREGLGIRKGVRRDLKHFIQKKFMPSAHADQAKLAISKEAAPEALSQAAVYLTKAARKELCLNKLGKILVHGNFNMEQQDELRKNVTSILGAGLPRLGAAHDHARILIKNEGDYLTGDALAKPLAEIVSVRSYLPAEQHGWVDKLVDRKAAALPLAFANIESDEVANAAVDWLCDQLKKNQVSGEETIETLYGELCAVARGLAQGSRRDTLLTGLADLADTIPDLPQKQLLIYSLVRLAGPEWAASAGKPELLDKIAEKELELYPRLISQGHAFRKHVLGENNILDGHDKGREFDDIIDTTGDRATVKRRFEAHIRQVMENPTEYSEESNGTRCFYDDHTGTRIHANPMSKDGGTAYVEFDEPEERGSVYSL